MVFAAEYVVKHSPLLPRWIYIPISTMGNTVHSYCLFLNIIRNISIINIYNIFMLKMIAFTHSYLKTSIFILVTPGNRSICILISVSIHSSNCFARQRFSYSNFSFGAINIYKILPKISINQKIPYSSH